MGPGQERDKKKDFVDERNLVFLDECAVAGGTNANYVCLKV